MATKRYKLNRDTGITIFRDLGDPIRIEPDVEYVTDSEADQEAVESTGFADEVKASGKGKK